MFNKTLVLKKYTVHMARYCFIIFLNVFIFNVAHAITCTTSKTTCVAPGGTRYVAGIAVTLPCWAYQTIKTCDTGKHIDTCTPLRQAGCNAISATCIAKLGKFCITQEKTLRCPQKTCAPDDGIICGQDFYCMQGNCAKHITKHSKDFDKAVTELSAVGGAAKDIKKAQGVSAFSGNGEGCRKYGYFGFNNCCKDSGWGQDIGLAHCNGQEKQLGLSREKGLAIDLGFHCDHKYPIIGGCERGHEEFCVFPSKLSFIIQTQGRRQQLGIGFGSADSPNCRGLTPEELSKLDFSKMDFSALYKEIEQNTHFPNTGNVQDDIAKRVHDFYNRKKTRQTG